MADTGSGLPTDDFETLVQPFYSTKGRGSGMGLALVHRIVIDHGGTLEFQNLKPQGALIRITLPHTTVESFPERPHPDLPNAPGTTPI